MIVVAGNIGWRFNRRADRRVLGVPGSRSLVSVPVFQPTDRAWRTTSVGFTGRQASSEAVKALNYLAFSAAGSTLNISANKIDTNL